MTMPRRLALALFTLIIVLATAVPAAAAPAGPGFAGAATTARFQDDGSADGALTEETLSAFSMPGMTPDNLTDSVLADIDAFWAEEFAANGNDYSAAGITPVTDPVYSSCGQFGPYDNPAAFCPIDDTVYVSVPLGQEIQSSIGDFAWITVLAHEWGHHVQLLLGIAPELTIDRELQADCFAGAYAQRALVYGYLQDGDVTEAVLINIMSGDPVEMDEMADGAHGSSDYRVTSFMQGYFGGASSCLQS
jgi:predicted metalloprotease